MKNIMLALAIAVAVAAPSLHAQAPLSARECLDSYIIQGDYYLGGEDRDICEHRGAEFASKVLRKVQKDLRQPLATFVALCIKDYDSDPDDRDYFTSKDARKFGVPIREKSDYCHVRHHAYSGAGTRQTVSLYSVLWAIVHTDRLTSDLTAWRGQLYEWDPNDSKQVEERKSYLAEKAEKHSILSNCGPGTDTICP